MSVSSSLVNDASAATTAARGRGIPFAATRGRKAFTCIRRSRLGTSSPLTAPPGDDGRGGRESGGRRCARARAPTTVALAGAGGADSSGGSKGFGLLDWLGPVVPQGVLVTGVKAGWRAAWVTMMTELAPQSRDGEYKRPSYTFDGVISPDPRAAFPAVSGRYVVYVGNACPWCHRVTLTIALRGLRDRVQVVSMTDDAERASRGGWVFDNGSDDPVFGASDLREVYDKAVPAIDAPYTGRCTAPFMVDATRRRAVNNESSDICRMLNDVDIEPRALRGGGTGGSSSSSSSSLRGGCGGEGDGDGDGDGLIVVELRPPELIADIDAWNDKIYDGLNNGVYRCGFATEQSAHERAAREVSDTLQDVEVQLSKTRFLCGDKVTEADVRLFPTIVRFDVVYATLFKCSSAGRRVADFPNISRWMRHFYTLPGVADTVDFSGYRKSYFGQLFPLNPGGIVPVGPTEQDVGLVSVMEEERLGASFDPADVFHFR